MTEKYLLFSLNDKKTKGLAEAISNPTCKRILELLSEKELTEGEIANELKMPQNTIEYNIRKLISTGLIEQKSHFWSVKGKKMPVYTVSNKHIVISPKTSSKFRSFIPVIFISLLGAFVIKFSQLITSSISYASKNTQIAADFATESMLKATESIPTGQAAIQPDLIREILIGSAWLWFLAGSLFALLIFFFLNYKVKGGQNG